MKKLFMVLIVMLFGFVLVGCNNEKEEKVNIDFRVNYVKHLVEIDKGSVISNDIIPLENKGEAVELYFDENKTDKYLGETINEDVIIYVALKNECETMNDNENLKYLEEEDSSLVSFIVQNYTYAFSSVSGPTMKFNKDGAVFECSIDKGSFHYYKDQKAAILLPNERIQWCPSYIINRESNSSCFIEEVENNAYMNVIIKIDEKIVGFIVLKMNRIERTQYSSQVLASIMFSKVDDEYQNVPLEYVLNRINDIKK